MRPSKEASELHTVRLASVSDAPEIARVHQAAGRVSYADYGEAALVEWAATFAAPEHIVERIASSRAAFVAEADGRICGSVFVGDGPLSEDVIGGLYAWPLAAGVGSALLKIGLERLRSDGFGYARAFVMEQNPRGQQWFSRRGFVCRGTVPSQMFPPDGRAVEMSLAFASTEAPHRPTAARSISR